MSARKEVLPFPPKIEIRRGNDPSLGLVEKCDSLDQKFKEGKKKKGRGKG